MFRSDEAGPVVDDMHTALIITAANIRSLAAAGKCTTYDGWLKVVEDAIAKAEGRTYENP